jgi:hypothetical protein
MRQELLRKSDILEGLIKNTLSLKTYNSEYSIGYSSVGKNFDQYFDLIQMYKGTVLTRNNKETIEKLRIGTQLDELDQEFDERFVEDMKSKVLESIYLSLDEQTASINSKVIEYSSQIAQIRLNIKKLKIDLTEPPIELSRESIALEESISDYVDRKTGKANSYLQSSLNQFYDKHTNDYNDHLSDRSKLMKSRKKRVIKWTIISGLLATFMFLVYYFGVGIPAASYGDAIIASIVANIIGNLVGYFYSKYKNDPEKIEANSNKEFTNNQKLELSSLLSDEFWEKYKGLFDQDVTLTSSSEIKMRFLQVSTSWQEKNRQKLASFQNGLSAQLGQLVSISNNYFGIISSLHRLRKTVFKNSGNNSNIVSEITQEIKDASIRPSFDILSDTTKSLIQVREKIQMIEK